MQTHRPAGGGEAEGVGGNMPSDGVQARVISGIHGQSPQ